MSADETTRLQELEARLEFADAGLKKLTDAGWELAAERDRLRAIIEGRATPPTDAEMRAHDEAGGSWLVWWGRESYATAPAWLPYRRPGYALKPWDLAQRWIALGADGRPCAWPVASEGGAS